MYSPGNVLLRAPSRRSPSCAVADPPKRRSRRLVARLLDQPAMARRSYAYAERSGAPPSRASTAAMSPSFTVEAAGKRRSAPAPAARPSVRSCTHAARYRGPPSRAASRRRASPASVWAATAGRRAPAGSRTAPREMRTRVTPAPAVNAIRTSWGPGATFTPKRTRPPRTAAVPAKPPSTVSVADVAPSGARATTGPVNASPGAGVIDSGARAGALPPPSQRARRAATRRRARSAA